MENNVTNILYLLQGEQQYYNDLLRLQESVSITYENVSPSVQRLIAMLSKANAQSGGYNRAKIKAYIDATIDAVLQSLNNSALMKLTNLFKPDYLNHLTRQNLNTEILLNGFKRFFTDTRHELSSFFLRQKKQDMLHWNPVNADKVSYYEILDKLYVNNAVHPEALILDVTASLIFLKPVTVSGDFFEGTSNPFFDYSKLLEQDYSIIVDLGDRLVARAWSEAIENNQLKASIFNALSPFILDKPLKQAIDSASVLYEDIKLATVYALDQNSKATTEVSNNLNKVIHDIKATQYIYTVTANKSFEALPTDLIFLNDEFDSGIDIEGTTYRRVLNNPSCFFEIINQDGNCIPVETEFTQTETLLYNKQLSTQCCEEIELSEICRVTFPNASNWEEVFNKYRSAVIEQKEVPTEEGMKTVNSTVFDTLEMSFILEKTYMENNDGVKNHSYITNERNYENYLLNFKPRNDEEDNNPALPPALCATLHIKLAICPQCGKIYIINNSALILSVSLAFLLHAKGTFPFENVSDNPAKRLANKKLVHSLNKKYFESRFGTAFNLLKKYPHNNLDNYSLDYTETPMPEFDGISLQHALNDVYKEKKLLVRSSRASSLPNDVVDLYSHLVSVCKVIFNCKEEDLSPEKIIPDFFRRIQVRSNQPRFETYQTSANPKSQSKTEPKFESLPIANIPLIRLNSIIGGTNLLLTIRDYYYTVLYKLYDKANLFLEASCLGECYNIETFQRILSGYLDVLYRYAGTPEYVPICDYCIILKEDVEVLEGLLKILESSVDSLDERKDNLPENFPEEFLFSESIEDYPEDRRAILKESEAILKNNTIYTRREIVILTYAYLEHLSCYVVNAEDYFTSIADEALDGTPIFSQNAFSGELSILSRIGTASCGIGYDVESTFEVYVRTLFHKIEARLDRQPLKYLKDENTQQAYLKDPSCEVLKYDSSPKPKAPKVSPIDIHLPFMDFIYLMALILKVSFQSSQNSLKKLIPFHATIKPLNSRAWPLASLFRYRIDAGTQLDLREIIAYNYLDLLCSSYFTYDCSKDNYLDYVDKFDGRFVNSSVRELFATLIRDKTQLKDSAVVSNALNKEALNASTGYFDIVDEYSGDIYSEKEIVNSNIDSVSDAYKTFTDNRLNDLKLILKRYKCISSEKMLFPDTHFKSNLLMLLPDPFSDKDNDVLMRMFLYSNDKLDEVCQHLELKYKTDKTEEEYDGLKTRLNSCLSISPESVFSHFKDFFEELSITSPYVEKLYRKV